MTEAEAPNKCICIVIKRALFAPVVSKIVAVHVLGSNWSN